MLDVSQAHELKLAFRREGPWTNEDIKALSERKGLLRQVYDVLHGTAEIVVKAVAPVAEKITEKVEQVTKKFTVWIRAKVGGLTKAQIVEKLNGTDAGDGKTFQINEYAQNVLAKKECTITEKAEETEFATASPRDLGFTKNPMTKEFLADDFLAPFGLELCRPDDGPSLRRAYTDQPDGEWLPIAMKPIFSGGDWGVFSLRRLGSGLWLRTGFSADPGARWALVDRFVFRVRKIVQS